MFTRRSTVLTLAIWLGLFMAVLMPLHGYTHCEISHHTLGQSEVGESHGNILDNPDLCSICKGLSHLSLVHAQVGAGNFIQAQSYVAGEQTPLKPSSGLLTISPRSPPLASLA